MNGQTSPTTKPRLWNPNAAANWCMILSPLFGAVLHGLNWLALGKPGKAKASFIWGIVFVILLFAGTFLDIEGRVYIAFLFIWYFAAGRPQVKYVKENLGDAYEKRPWLIPISAAVGGIIAYIVFAVVAECVVNALRG